jgi:hypothetical protein
MASQSRAELFEVSRYAANESGKHAGDEQKWKPEQEHPEARA